jgi:Family of unknown function (DUF6789)
MTLGLLIHIAIAGVIATYCHLIGGLWIKSLGLPPLDLSRAMADYTYGDSFSGPPSYWAGQVLICFNGAVFALFYATAVGPFLPGPGVIRGMIFAMLLFLLSGLLFSPIFIDKGLFLAKVHERAWISALVVHLVWGIVLGWLCPVITW